jgi:RNA polymerase sigma factor (sigma-70 family)
VQLVPESGVSDVALGIDEVLWRRSVDGDGEAFGLLFDRHRDRVFTHASRITDSRQDAEDVLASSFLELWRRRSTVQLVDGSVLPWLLATTTNLGRNTARSTRRYRRFLDRLPRSEDFTDGLDASSYGVDPGLKTGLGLLGKVDAQLLALVALEGLPVAVAAKQLELTESAARSRLHRARAKIRKHVGDSLDEALSAEEEKR